MVALIRFMPAGRSLICMQEDVRIPPRQNSDQKRVIQFLALEHKRKKKTFKSERKLLGNYDKCALSVHWF